MAKIIKKSLKWMAGTSIDIVATKLYWCPETEVLGYDSPNVTIAMPATEIILPDEAPGFPLDEGNFKLGISSVDDVGNESDIAEIAVPFDFAAPDAPTDLVVEDI